MAGEALNMDLSLHIIISDHGQAIYIGRVQEISSYPFYCEGCRVNRWMGSTKIAVAIQVRCVLWYHCRQQNRSSNGTRKSYRNRFVGEVVCIHTKYIVVREFVVFPNHSHIGEPGLLKLEPIFCDYMMWFSFRMKKLKFPPVKNNTYINSLFWTVCTRYLPPKRHSVPTLVFTHTLPAQGFSIVVWTNLIF